MLRMEGDDHEKPPPSRHACTARLGPSAAAAVRHGKDPCGARRTFRRDHTPTMIAVRASQPTVIGISIARRAVDLALDGRVSFDEGAHHLRRLARGRRAPLEDALREIGTAPDSNPGEACARLLLQQAIAGVPIAAIPQCAGLAS